MRLPRDGGGVAETELVGDAVKRRAQAGPRVLPDDAEEHATPSALEVVRRMAAGLAVPSDTNHCSPSQTPAARPVIRPRLLLLPMPLCVHNSSGSSAIARWSSAVTRCRASACGALTAMTWVRCAPSLCP